MSLLSFFLGLRSEARSQWSDFQSGFVQKTEEDVTRGLNGLVTFTRGHLNAGRSEADFNGWAGSATNLRRGTSPAFSKSQARRSRSDRELQMDRRTFSNLDSFGPELDNDPSSKGWFENERDSVTSGFVPTVERRTHSV